MKSIGDLVKGKQLYVVRKGQSVREVVRVMAENNIGAVPVLEGDRLIGIFSERDLMVRCVSVKRELDSTKIENVMTKDVFIMNTGDGSEKCIQAMKKKKIRHLPVCDGDKLVGIISMRDLMQFQVEEKEHEIEVLQSYIHYNPR